MKNFQKFYFDYLIFMLKLINITYVILNYTLNEILNNQWFILKSDNFNSIEQQRKLDYQTIIGV